MSEDELVHKERLQVGIFPRLQKVISDNLDVEISCITLDSYLSGDLGADELDTVELFIALEEEFAIEINDDEVSAIAIERSSDNGHYGSISSWHLSSLSSVGWGFNPSEYMVKDILLLVCRKAIDKAENTTNKQCTDSKEYLLNKAEERIDREKENHEREAFEFKSDVKIIKDLAFQRLLQKCMGDHNKAERLISYEIQKFPGRSREEAIQAAVIRWEMDER